MSRFTGGPDPDVQHFDNGGERHRKIDVTSFDVLADSVGDEDNADQNQKGEGEHFDGRVPIDESADRPGGEKHDEHRNGHRSDHHRKFFRHGHGRDDGIQRKNDVEERDLNHRAQKTAASLCNRTGQVVEPLAFLGFPRDCLLRLCPTLRSR